MVVSNLALAAFVGSPDLPKIVPIADHRHFIGILPSYHQACVMSALCGRA
jgi:hypothetical protein